MNGQTATIFFSIAICGLSFSFGHAAARSTSPDEAVGSAVTKQSDITIWCPAQIEYHAQPIADWNAGFHGIKRSRFEDAVVSGRTLACNYLGSSGDASTLLREMPAGYICTIKKTVGRNRKIDCKRAVPPINIKPRS